MDVDDRLRAVRKPAGVIEIQVSGHDVPHVAGSAAEAGDLPGRGLTRLQDGLGAVEEGPAE